MNQGKSIAVAFCRSRETKALQGPKLLESWRRRNATFGELVQDALAYGTAHKRSYDADVYRIERLTSWFVLTPADAITPQEIERHLVEAVEEEESAPATLNRYPARLSLTFRLGTQNGQVATNPARVVKRRRENNARIRWRSPDEERSLSKNGEWQYVPLNAAPVAALTRIKPSEHPTGLFF